MKKGLVSEGLVESIDYFPTCMELLDIDPKIPLPGKSIAPALMGEEQDLAGPVFSEFRGWRMVRNGNLKLVVRGKDWVPSELFDLESDPYEMNNLVHEEEHKQDVKRLSEILQQWRKSHPKIPSLFGQIKLWFKEKIYGV